MSTDFTEQWSNMQKMFLQSSEMSASFRESARLFWENQGKVLDNMQALAEWLVRSAPYRNSRSARGRRTYVRNQDVL